MYRTPYSLICHDGKPGTLQPIATAYNGVLFRSRLEARWAVFMDAMRVRYVYEPDAYDLGDCQYLPDFLLPDLETFLEIKPAYPSALELRKAERLAEQSGTRVIVLFGYLGYVTDPCLACAWDDDPFERSTYNSILIDGSTRSVDSGFSGDTSYAWCECSKCGTAGLEYEGRGSRLRCGCNGEDHHVNTARLRRAYEAALYMRFDRASVRRVRA